MDSLAPHITPLARLPQVWKWIHFEFGISSLPHIKTIESHLIDSPQSEIHPHSHTVDHHNKEMQHEHKMATYLIENF